MPGTLPYSRHRRRRIPEVIPNAVTTMSSCAKRVTGTPFAWWDTWVYVPLCALLAVSSLLVALSDP